MGSTTAHCLGQLTMLALALYSQLAKNGPNYFDARLKRTMTEVMYGKAFCKRAKSADLAAKQGIQRRILERETRIVQLRGMFFTNLTEKRKEEARVSSPNADARRVAEIRRLESEILQLKARLRCEL